MWARKGKEAQWVQAMPLCPVYYMQNMDFAKNI